MRYILIYNICSFFLINLHFPIYILFYETFILRRPTVAYTVADLGVIEEGGEKTFQKYLYVVCISTIIYYIYEGFLVCEILLPKNMSSI